jgi:dephospho-CoA kinase
LLSHDLAVTLHVSGDIDRAKLGQLVFADAAARRRLNKATHAPVALELLRQLLGHWLRFRQVVVSVTLSKQQQQQRMHLSSWSCCCSC